MNEVTNGRLLNAPSLTPLPVISLLCIVGEFVIPDFNAHPEEPACIIREIRRK